MRSWLYVVLRFLLWLPIKLLFRIRVVGRENEPAREEGPYLVCANHQTAIDVIFMAIALKHQQPHFMAKAELFKVPVLGWLVRQLGAFPVARGGGNAGAVKHAVELLENGRSVGIFPQGTRCAGQELRDCPVKAGAGLIAARAGARVLPVYIKMKDHRWRFLRPVTVVVGEPIPFESFSYNPEEKGEYLRITEEVYDTICRMEEECR